MGQYGGVFAHTELCCLCGHSNVNVEPVPGCWGPAGKNKHQTKRQFSYVTSSARSTLQSLNSGDKQTRMRTNLLTASAE